MASSSLPLPSGKTAKASRWKNRLAYLLVCCLVTVLYLSGALTGVERQLDEAKFGFLKRPATGDVVLVEIDARSLSELDVWPWPRSLHATLVERLLDAGVSRIAFDVDFSTYSSGAQDARFAAALKAANPKVILPVFRQRASDRATNLDLVDSLPAQAFLPHVDLAGLNIFPSDDGKVRELFVDMEVDGRNFPSLAVFLAGHDAVSGISFAVDFGIDPATVPRLSYADVAQGLFRPDAVAGKLVVIGSTAAELGDFVAVPGQRALPGPLIHILGYESIVQGRALQRVSSLPIIVLAVLLVLVLGPISQKVSLGRAFVGAVSLAFLLVVTSTWLQGGLPVQIDTVPLVLAVVLTYVATMANRIDQQSIRLIFQRLDIRRKNLMMRNLIEKSIVGVVICDETGRLESLNDAAAQMFGYDVHEFDNSYIEKLVPALAEQDETNESPLHNLADIGQREMWGRRPDGTSFPVEITASKVESDERTVFVAFVNDITARHLHEEELQFRADHDALTGLANRTKFARKLQNSLEEAAEIGSNVAVFLLDLDRFKDVNDTLGHAVGDRLLQDVAKRLAPEMSGGAMLARFGGDEFAMYLPNVLDTAAIEVFAGNIINVLKRPFDVDGLNLEVGGSIGYAVYPDDGDTTDTLLQRSDIAMYSAKRYQSGFSKYWVEDDLHSVRNLTLTGDLRRAIDENELELVFQPKTDLATEKVTGVEVLCRWNRPGHGFVSPDEFIGHAEQSGLIYPLTEWVLRKAVETGAIWRELGWDLNVAVNLSARLLHHEQILSLVTETLESWDYPAEALTLEITENALLVNPAHAMIVISEFAGLGIKVSIDDFGTGYSSLSYLTTLNASELKIDKSFVLGMSKEKNFKTVVKSVVSMAHDLNMKVVAEGIETKEAVAELQHFGCDIGQGYFFGKPMSVDDFEKWLKTSDWGLAPSSEVSDVKSA